jgi:hypothetical protein
MQNRERILQITPEIKVLIQNIFYLKTSKMLKKQILESEIQNQLDFLFPEGGIFKVQINNLESEPLDS